MKILFITNASTERCGVRAFGEEMIAALRRAGDEVDVWDGTYSAVVQHGYLPPYDQLARYDVVHLNWDPQAINHYLPQHFPTNVPLSLFLHDVPPNSVCPVQSIARWVFAHEPGEGIQVMPQAMPRVEGLPPAADPPFFLPPDIVIGVSGIRDDPGFALVKDLCAQKGFTLNAPLWWNGGPWIATEDEIRRLALSTVNVCWYHTSGRGKSMAAMFALASGRPLVCSKSTMFSALWAYEDEIYFPHEAHETSWPTELIFLLERAIFELVNGGVKRPDRVRIDLDWDRVIQPVRDAWMS